MRTSFLERSKPVLPVRARSGLRGRTPLEAPPIPRHSSFRYRDSTAPRRHLMVATSGGHVEEALRLRERLFGPNEIVEWVTHPQAAVTFPEGEIVHRTDYIGPREAQKALRQVPQALAILRQREISCVVSTGAAIALPFLVAGQLLGLECHYIESAARAAGPSLTGKLVAQLNHTRLYTQYPFWANRQWSYAGSIFDGYSSVSVQPRNRIDKVVVTLGTMQNYGFERAVAAIQRSLAEFGGALPEVLWQTGCTQVGAAGIAGHNFVPAEDLRQAVDEADLVIAHGGVGSALMALECGKAPLLLPRSHDFHEHVDGHQKWIAQELSRRSLAITCDPDSLSAKYLVAAMSGKVAPVSTPPQFLLETSPRQHQRMSA